MRDKKCKRFWLAFFIIILTLVTCQKAKNPEAIMDAVAEGYVKLVLEVGLYDGDYVDAYYGPEEWKPDPSEKQEPFPYAHLTKEVQSLLSRLDRMDTAAFIEIDLLRLEHLRKQLMSVKAKIELINGAKMSFDEESQALYDAVSPSFSKEHYDSLLKELEEEIPGQGDLAERFKEYRRQFVIPDEKLEEVLQTAIDEAKRRTLAYIELPDNDSFQVNMVRDKPWRAYNWYKGNFFSVIDWNLDATAYVELVIDIACHEAYPGHHLYNSLREINLYRGKGWAEFCIYPLFAPQSLIGEGTANYGIELAFPGDERIQYEKEVIFPLAGLDPDEAERYYRILGLLSKLSYAEIDAARNYLDGKISEEERSEWLSNYLLWDQARIEQTLAFHERYRSYLINYVYGLEMVREYIERNGGSEDHLDRSWELFLEILSTPRTPSGLK